MVDSGLLVCLEENCKAELGRVIKVKISQHTRRLGIWDIKKIRIAGETSDLSLLFARYIWSIFVFI